MSRQTLFLLLIIVIVGVALACGRWPPVVVKVDNSRVHIDVRNLGEYGTSVSRIRISNRRSSEVIWEVVNPAAPQIPGFWLELGDNQPMPENLADFGFVTVAPDPSSTFELNAGIEYTVEVWSKDQKSVVSEVFVFQIVASRLY